MNSPLELEQRLAALGLNVRAEALDRHVVLVPTTDSTNLADAGLRAAVLAVAREAGFSHVSLEVFAPGCASSSP
ncbi:MAG: hypothetical protein U0163_11505 [Gemmatimonadaceae bacterium]